MATDRDLIIKLRADTKQLSKDLRKAKSQMKGFSKSINKIGAGIQSTMLAAFGGAAILQGIRIAVGSLADFEFAMDKVEAISGATGDTLESLKKNALDLGRTTKFTATEIANLQLELSKLGFGSDKILASTDAIRKLATVADEDLGESAKTLAGTLNSFNLEASESERIANVMAESFSKSALTLEKFTVATANSGAIANALGVTLESNTARLGTLVDANIDASKAGTDLRKIYIDLNKAGITYDQALEMVANSSDKVGKATELVGIRAAGALVILSQQRLKVDDLTKSLGDNNRELDHMVGIMEDNLLTDWKKFTSALDGAIQKGSTLNGIFRGTVQVLTGMVAGLTGGGQSLEAFERAGIDVSSASGVTIENMRDLAIFTKKVAKEVDNATSSIKDGSLAYDGINISTLSNVDALAKVQFGLKQFVGSPFFKEIKAALIPLMEELTGKIEDQAKAFEKASVEAKKLAEISGVGASVSGIEGLDAPGLEGVELPLIVISDESVEVAIEKNKQQFAKIQEGIITDIEALSMEINMILESTVESAIIGVAAALGSGAGLKAAFGVVLGVLSEGMGQIGKAMIAYGIAGEAFQKALSSLSPGIAIAAGVALVAAAGALRSAQGGFASSNSGGGGGGSRGSGSFAFDRSGQSVDVGGTFKIAGSDLVLVLNQQNREDSRNLG